MSSMNPTQRVVDVVDAVEHGKYRLPSIQRSFVWAEDQTCKLLDSLMNDYPIGALLVWRPGKGVQVRARRFERTYRHGMRQVSEPAAIGRDEVLVLDGQQRLQSLYLAFYGSYDGKRLHYRVDSDPKSPEDGLRHVFRFLKPDEAIFPWVPLQDLRSLRIENIQEWASECMLGGDADRLKLVVRNVSRFVEIFCRSSVLLLQEVESSLPPEDVLEVFVRINSAGTPLSRSDLVFSTIVLKAPEMEQDFLSLADEISAGGHFDFDTDFIVKTTFVLLDKKAKYEVAKLNDEEFVKRLRSEFETIKRALISVREFLGTDAKILAKRFLRSEAALIPIADYIFQQPHQQLPEGQAKLIRQYLYMSFLLGFYSYGADGKLDKIHETLKKVPKGGPFPAAEIGAYMADNQRVPYAYRPEMLLDTDMVINMVQGGITEIPKHRGWSLERDHIFSRSALGKASVRAELINSPGNFRLLNKVRNILKSDALPGEDCEFFGSEDPDVRALFLQARRELSEENVKAFVEARAAYIGRAVRNFLGLPEPVMTEGSAP